MGLGITNRQPASGQLENWTENEVRLIMQFYFQPSLPHCSSSMLSLWPSCKIILTFNNFPTLPPFLWGHLPSLLTPFRLTCRYWSDLSWSQGKLCTAQWSNGFAMQLPQWKPQGMEHTPHHAVPTLCQLYLDLTKCQGVESTFSVGVNFGQVFRLFQTVYVDDWNRQFSLTEYKVIILIIDLSMYKSYVKSTRILQFLRHSGAATAGPSHHLMPKYFCWDGTCRYAGIINGNTMK